MSLHQYFLPDLKDKIITRKFLKGIRTKKYWVPRAAHITRTAVCAFPPTKQVLADIIFEVLTTLPPQDASNDYSDESFRRTAIQIRRKPPNKRWMIQIIAVANLITLFFQSSSPSKWPSQSRLLKRDSLTTLTASLMTCKSTQRAAQESASAPLTFGLKKWTLTQQRFNE